MAAAFNDLRGIMQDIFEIELIDRYERGLKYFINAMERYDDQKFVRRFRFSKDTTLFVFQISLNDVCPVSVSNFS